jgi:uncharacterized membrane protein
MWILWALLSAFFAASRRTSQKQMANRLHHFTIGFMLQLFALPVIAVALAVSGKVFNPFSLGSNFWIPTMVVTLGFYPLNAYLSVKAIKDSELSKVLPLQSLWPVFSLLPAWLFLHQTPSVIAVLGVILTVLGVYVLGLKGKTLHHPLQPFKEDKGSVYMICGVVLVTGTSILDKIAIQASGAIYYSFVSTVLAVITLAAELRVCKVEYKLDLRQNSAELVKLGSFQGISYTTYLLAIGYGPIAYATAIRGNNVLIGSILGIILLNEKLTKPKIASFILIALGSIVLALGS